MLVRLELKLFSYKFGINGKSQFRLDNAFAALYKPLKEQKYYINKRIKNNRIGSLITIYPVMTLTYDEFNNIGQNTIES